jgi:hypothetical protein
LRKTLSETFVERPSLDKVSDKVSDKEAIGHFWDKPRLEGLAMAFPGQWGLSAL